MKSSVSEMLAGQPISIEKKRPTTRAETQLMEGDFIASEAREPLLTLIRDKIKYHELRNFSSKERFGKSDLHSEDTINALKKFRAQAIALLKIADQKNMTINVESAIKISIGKTEILWPETRRASNL